MVAEDRNLLHPETASLEARKLYAEGYSLAALRAQAIRRAAWDRHHDRYEGIKIVFRALAHGEERLGLPALGIVQRGQVAPSRNCATKKPGVYGRDLPAWMAIGKTGKFRLTGRPCRPRNSGQSMNPAGAPATTWRRR